MKFLFVLILFLFLFSCSDGDSTKCSNKGPLCKDHPEDYLKCQRYEYYNASPYDHVEHVYLRTWYKVKNDSDEWTSWPTYLEMYNYYCL